MRIGVSRFEKKISNISNPKKNRRTTFLRKSSPSHARFISFLRKSCSMIKPTFPNDVTWNIAWLRGKPPWFLKGLVLLSAATDPADCCYYSFPLNCEPFCAARCCKRWPFQARRRDRAIEIIEKQRDELGHEPDHGRDIGGCIVTGARD